ncbi:DUF6009 family protein [Streptomyces sp. NPDC007808]|uniref:DUF6009 family protein n=1 Tax=Streptomyces sp. NPDC007808 TaxID=3364779 RepID=UPI00369D7F86
MGRPAEETRTQGGPAFLPQPHDRDTEPDGPYARSAPAEGVDPRTRQPRVKGLRSDAEKAARLPASCMNSAYKSRCEGRGALSSRTARRPTHWYLVSCHRFEVERESKSSFGARVVPALGRKTAAHLHHGGQAGGVRFARPRCHGAAAGRWPSGADVLCEALTVSTRAPGRATSGSAPRPPPPCSAWPNSSTALPDGSRDPLGAAPAPVASAGTSDTSPPRRQGLQRVFL